MKKYISSKPIVKIIVIALFSLILSLIGLSSSSAFEERNLKKTLKIIEYCQKTNPQKLNVYKNLRKSELINEIDRFVKQIKAAEKKIKFDFLNNATTIEKFDSFKLRLDNITNTINKSFKITDSQVENLICGECFDPELPNDCETIKFVQKLVEASSENTPYVWADAEIYQYFIKSQDAIRSNDYNTMCLNFNNIHPLVDKYIKNIPNCSTCPDGNCEWCETIQDELTGEFNFLKLYIEIQKGYFFVQNKTYAKAESYFNQLLNELSSQLPENPTLISCRNNTYIEKMSPLTKQKLMKSCYFFVGYIQMLQKRYTEANNSFLKFHNFGNDRNLKSYTDLLPFPRSGLYQDFDCQEIVSRENINFPSTIIKMQAYTFYFMGICNENLGNKDAALTRYREYVKLNNPDYLNDAQNRILKLENIPTPIEIVEINVFLISNTQTPVDWDQILKVKDTILIQAKGQGLDINHSETVKCKLSSSVTNLAGIDLILTETGPNTNTFEAKYQIDLNMVDVTKNKYKSITSVDASDLSIAGDSDVFDSNTFILSKVLMGSARLSPIKGKTPIASSKFLKNAGCEILTVLSQNQSNSILVQNQADWLYFSGHGNHKDGKLKTSSGKMDIGPEDISATKEWDEDLDIVIIAGCSVLDYNDYNNNYSFWKETNPGIMWKKAAHNVKTWLGYNYSAPKSPGDKKIIKDFFTYLPQLHNYAESWLKANRDNRACNACAIDSQGYWYIKYSGWTRLNNWYRSTPYPIIGPIQLSEKRE
jgi:tetratricopeptide (TPR) repeat protein